MKKLSIHCLLSLVLLCMNSVSMAKCEAELENAIQKRAIADKNAKVVPLDSNRMRADFIKAEIIYASYDKLSIEYELKSKRAAYQRELNDPESFHKPAVLALYEANLCLLGDALKKGSLDTSNASKPQSNDQYGNSSGSDGTLALRCNESFDTYINSLPSFNGNLLRNVVRSLRTDSALLMSEARAGKIVPSAYIPEYQRMLSDFGNSENTAFENHKKLSTSGPGAAMCNPQDGSQASAWAASRLGVAFATWAINIVQCVSGQQSPKPIPAFCPY